jgi:hypothetical protein
MTDEHLNNNDSDDNWDDRVLCPDESCTGTIGEDGHCRVCGLVTDGKPASSAPFTETSKEASFSPGDDDEAPEDGPDDLFEESDDDTDDASPWEDRILCPDESCIGTIGPDGHCSECGRAHGDEAASDDG